MSKQSNSRRLPLMVLALAAGVALGVASPGASAAATFACEDESGLCIDSGGASWEADKTSTSKDRKKRSSKSAGSLSLSIDGGRGKIGRASCRERVSSPV